MENTNSELVFNKASNSSLVSRQVVSLSARITAWNTHRFKGRILDLSDLPMINIINNF